jgi:dolichyl-phosphate-mannose-protein mannosyltransferase
MQNCMNFIIDFIEKYLVIIYILIILVFSSLTYFSNFQYPNGSIWDEAFHISSGEKYLQGVAFMEAHPPLGKLFIALGEKIVNPNTSYNELNFLGKLCLSSTPASYQYTEIDGDGKEVIKRQDKVEENGKVRQMNLLDVRQKTKNAIDKSAFLNTDAIGSDVNGDGKGDNNYPEYYSFCGARVFSTFFGLLTPIIYFFIAYLITRNRHIALLSSSLVIFDNAFLVQSRAAMLDAPQLFFTGLSILMAVIILEKINNKKSASFQLYCLLSTFISLTVVTKHNGAIFILLLIICLMWEMINTNWKFKKLYGNLKYNIKEVFKIWPVALKFIMSCVVILVVYLLVFSIHFGLGNQVNTKNVNNGGKYKMSQEYINIIERKETWNPINWPVMMRDNWKYMSEYHIGVAKLDYSNKKENGSYPTNWPVMNRTISYRWESVGNDSYRYTYLIGNPAIWLISFITLYLVSSLFISTLFFKNRVHNWRLFGYLGIFLFLYIIYMTSMMYSISIRTMYLYHYFAALFLTMLMFPVLLAYWFNDQILNHEIDIDVKNKPLIVYGTLILLVFIIAGLFAYYSPFTYYAPLNTQEFNVRNWFDFWQMRLANK